MSLHIFVNIYTMLYYFQVCSKVIIYIYIYTHTYTHIHIYVQILFPYRLLQNLEYSSL